MKGGIIARTRWCRDNPYYRFLLAARELFAYDAFHVMQHRYPHGYVFHVCEIIDKTPIPEGRDAAGSDTGEGDAAGHYATGR